MIEQIVRGPLLVPLENGTVAFHPDGALACDAAGTLLFAGDWAELQNQSTPDPRLVRASDGIMLPPLIDIHIHVPQHPIRGRFVEGVGENAPEGRLLAGLKRNVFPAEIQCNSAAHARQVTEAFLADTLSHGVVGGATYTTPCAEAARLALEILPPTWSVGLVLMNQNCPEDLRTNEPNLHGDVTSLASEFGRRLIITDRFAVAVNSPLRRRGSALAERYGLCTQTHLNEQTSEKHFVEHFLYPDSASYTDVYRHDGLLDHQCILAHCIHMRPDEWRMIVDSGSVIAHCPTSNVLLNSGTMSLDEVIRHKIPYALGTDVGASPTVSMLAEMGRFMQVHAGKSSRATAREALWRSTLAPARILGLEGILGRLEPGRPMSFIEAEPVHPIMAQDSDGAIMAILPADLDDPEPSINRVTLAGKSVFQRSAHHA